MTTQDKPCPICGKPAAGSQHQPFCSPRCRDVDLNRWLGGVYRVETNERPGDPPRRDEE